MIGDAPRTSVILPTYRREKELRDTLTALLQQADDSTEIIVVDQTEKHEPETTAFLARVSDRIKLVRRDRPGLVDALNAGAAEAQGDLLLLLDDDIVPSPRLLAAHREAFDDATIGIVAGRVVDDLGIVREATLVGRVLPTGEIEATYTATLPAEAESAPGGNMSVRRAVFEAVGGFQPGYRGTAVFNETDFCCLVRSRGWRIVFRPEAEFFHLRAQQGGCGNRKPSLQRSYSFYHNAMLFALRCLPWYSPALVAATMANDAVRTAFGERRPAYVLMLPVGLVHGAVTWIRTGARRYRPARRG
jgi:GT2 family glycosyltransferase